jgi:hypothetical protein
MNEFRALYVGRKILWNSGCSFPVIFDLESPENFVSQLCQLPGAAQCRKTYYPF